jgi:hypothetical protein
MVLTTVIRKIYRRFSRLSRPPSRSTRTVQPPFITPPSLSFPPLPAPDGRLQTTEQKRSNLQIASVSITSAVQDTQRQRKG